MEVVNYVFWSFSYVEIQVVAEKGERSKEDFIKALRDQACPLMEIKLKICQPCNTQENLIKINEIVILLPFPT